MSESIKDGRLPPFAWVSRASAEALYKEFQGRERTLALAIYTALALLSSAQRKGDHDGIIATRRELSTAAGVSDRTLDAYVARFEKVGLLEVTRRRDGGLNLPNIWTMMEPEGGGEHDSLPPSVSPGVANTVPEGGEADGTPLKENDKKSATDVADVKNARARAPETDPDAIRLCGVLRDLILENDPIAKVPAPGSAARDRWVRDMRLLIKDRDGNVREVELVLRWSQIDPFWCSNILSPAKLRAQFTALLLRCGDNPAMRAMRVAGSRGGSAQDARMQARRARIAALKDQPHEGDDDDPYQLTGASPALRLAAGAG